MISPFSLNLQKHKFVKNTKTSTDNMLQNKSYNLELRVKIPLQQASGN